MFTLAFITLIIFIMLTRRLSLFSLSQLNILSYANYSLLIFGVIGAVWIGFFGINHYLINLVDPDVQLKVSCWIVVAYIYIFGIIAFVLKFLGFEKVIKAYYIKRTRIISSPVIDILSLLVLLICVYYLLKLNPLETIQLLIQGDTAQLAVKRIDIARNGIRGLAFNSASLINLFFALYYMSLYVTSKRKLFYFVSHSIIVFTLSFFLLEKSIVIFKGIAFIILYATHKKLKLKYILIGGVGVIAFILFQYILFMDVNSILQALKAASYRTFIGQIAGTFLMVSFFGNDLAYLYGASFSRLICSLYGWNYMEPGRILMERLFPEAVVAGTAGRINSIFLGELYANFGEWALIFIILIPIFFLCYFVFFFKILPKDNLSVAFYATFTSIYSKSIITGFVYLIYSPTFIQLLSVYGFLKVITLCIRCESKFARDFNAKLS